MRFAFGLTVMRFVGPPTATFGYRIFNRIAIISSPEIPEVSLEISRRQLTPILDKPAFSRIP
jgi:hypothetical protein